MEEWTCIGAFEGLRLSGASVADRHSERVDSREMPCAALALSQARRRPNHGSENGESAGMAEPMMP